MQHFPESFLARIEFLIGFNANVSFRFVSFIARAHMTIHNVIFIHEINVFTINCNLNVYQRVTTFNS